MCLRFFILINNFKFHELESLMYYWDGFIQIFVCRRVLLVDSRENLYISTIQSSPVLLLATHVSIIILNSYTL